MNDLQRPPVCPLPSWKQALRFNREPLPLLEECRRDLGDVFCLRLPGGEHWAFLCSPKAVRSMFKVPREQLPAGGIHSRFIGALFGKDATFSLDGDAHRKRQRMVLPLLSGKANSSKVDLMREMTAERAAGWTDGQELGLLHECHRLSLDILVRLIFGDDDPAFHLEMADAFEHFSNLGARSKLVSMPKLQWNLGRFSPWGRVIHTREKTRALLRTKVESGRRDPESFSGTILGALLTTPDAGGEHLDDESVVDELMNMLFAGHETTGTFMAWALECIARHPHVKAELLAELERELDGGPFTREHLDQLPYLQGVIQETFRYRPVGPFSSFRMASAPVEIEGEGGRYRLQTGDVLAHCFPIMAMHPDVFEDPQTFKPERFMSDEHGVHEWTPFGGGGRICTGRGLALLELQVALATLTPMVDFELAAGDTRVERCGHLLAPAGGLPVRVRRGS